MSTKTPEEIQAQREAWLARKAAKAAGQDVPPPPAPAAPPPEPVAAAPAAAAPEPAAAPAPAAKKSPEELKAQREAFLAAKAAKAAGVAAPTPKPAAAESATASAPAPKPAAATAPKPAPAKKAAPAAPEKVDSHVTRREFLNYAWLASIALVTLQGVGLSLWFAFPNFKEGEFGGSFPLGAAQDNLPQVNAGPKPYTEGKFWLVNVDTQDTEGNTRTGVLALYKVCVHLGCLYDWVPLTNRFECPCHGSKYQLYGDYIEGPARRNLDRFVIQAVGPDGNVIAETDADGNPLVIDGDVNLVIDTGRRILGHPITTPA